MTDDDFKLQIDWLLRRLEAWPDKGAELTKLLPTEGLCSICYLSGKTDQPNHDLILLCPHPSALLVPYAWSNGRLRAGARYMADHSAFVDVVKALVDRYAGVNPAATGRWMRLHGAAQELLDACELAIPALSGFGDEAVALASLRNAVAEAKEPS